MSRIRSFDDALDFYPEAKANLRARFGGHLQFLRTFVEAITEGHAASRRYRELTARGMPHDRAVSKVFADHFR